MSVWQRPRNPRAGESDRAKHFTYVVRWRLGGTKDGAWQSVTVGHTRGHKRQADDLDERVAATGYDVTAADVRGWLAGDDDESDDDAKPLTVRECFDNFVARPSLSAGSRKSYTTIGNRLGDLADVRADRLTRAQVNRWLAGLKAGGLGSGSLFRTVGALMGALKGHASNDVWADAKFRKTTEVEPVILTRDQLGALKANAKGGDLYLPLWLMAETGMRWGEVAGLTAGNIDFANGEVKVRQGVTQMMRRRHGFTPGPLKSSASRREVPLGAELLAALALAKDMPADAPLFTQADHLERPECWTYANYLRAWKSLCASTEGVPDDTRIHDVRHSAAMRWLRGGDDLTDDAKPVPIGTVSRLLGHASLAVTDKMYTHITRDDKRAILSAGLSV